jgi:Tol biopolymer transport system component
VSTPRWSPDGASIAYLRADGIYLMDRDGQNQRRIFAATGISGLDW